MEDTQEPKLIANIWRTPSGAILQSKHRYDFVQDEYGYFIDGGLEGYIRMGGADCLGWDDAKWENLCVYSDDLHEKKREAFRWGTYGPKGDQPCKWVLLKDLETSHIQAIIETQRHIPEHIKDMFIDEIEFRKGLV